MRATVYHNISREAALGLNVSLRAADNERGYEKLTVPHSHPLVRVFEFEPGEADMPEALFRAFNVGDDPDYTESPHEFDLATRYRSRGLRSLSVGDVLDLNGMWLTVARTGWDATAREHLDILPADTAERVVRERYGFGPDEPLSVTVPLA